jgi:hypothetical protein
LTGGIFLPYLEEKYRPFLCGERNMFHKPQRPYYIYSDDQIPGEVTAERDVMSRSRLRQLIRDLTRRQAEAKSSSKPKREKPATTR